MSNPNSDVPNPFLEEVDLSEVVPEISGFINSIRILENRIATRALTGPQVVNEVAELFPPAVLFSPELQTIPMVYKALRDWLNDHGANVPPHSTRRVVRQLAANLYSTDEDKLVAETIAKDIVNTGRRVVRPAQEGVNVGEAHPPRAIVGMQQDKLAYYIGARFRDKDQKFSGDLGESWIEYVAEYQQVARDYGLTPAQKKQYLHNLLRGDAKRFYLDRVDNEVNGFTEAINLIGNEYNSIVRQSRVKNHLAGLRLSKYTLEGLDELESLEKVYKLITKLSPQVPMSHRSEAHKIEFLRNAVVGHAWATEPLSRVATHGLTFQQLYGELEAALHLAREAKLANMRDKIAVRAHRPADEDGKIPGILYQGPGRYANRHRGVGDTRRPARSYEQSGPLSIMGCFNCESREHMLNKCPHKVDLQKAARSKMKYLAKKTGNSRNAHVVLFELCQQLDSADSDPDEDAPETSNEPEFHVNEALIEEDPDFDLFDALVNYTQEAVGNANEKESVINLTTSCPPSRTQTFNGACLDTGAQRSVVGKGQAEAYYSFMGIPLALIPSTPRVYKFGAQRVTSIGKSKFRIPYAHGCHMKIMLDVVDVEVPLLLGLDVLDKHKLLVDTVDNRLRCRDPIWSVPIVRKLGHVYYEWQYEIMYTELELKKIHRHFYHPLPLRIYGMLKQAKDPNATPATLEALEKVTKSCDICQRISSQPGRFRVALPNTSIVFNRTVLMDLMALESTSVIHMVCKDTLFSAAVFLDGESADDVWTAYVRHWVTKYVGYSKAIHVDRGPQFDSDRWRHLLQSSGIQRLDSGIESHNALGSGEKYHDFLRRIYRKVRMEHAKIDMNDCLALAVHAMNNTAGPNGLSPTLLVFGVVPQLPLGFSDLPEQRDRMKALQDARSEMSKAVAVARIRTALNKNVPNAADRDIKIGSQVLFYREKRKEWEGPYLVVAGDGKNLWLNIKDDLKRVSVDKVREYVTTSTTQSSPDEQQRREINSIFDRVISGESFLTNIQNRLSNIQANTEGTKDVPETPNPICLVERISPSDARSKSAAFITAKKAEVQGLAKRNVWRVVDVSSLSASANIIGGRFELTLKNPGTHRQQAKARFIGQGYKDNLKEFIVHSCPTLRQSSTRVILSVSAIMNYRVAMVDFVQAYLQAKEKLTREIYLRVRDVDRALFGITNTQVLKLEKPLYGICDSGDYWGATLEFFIKKTLGMVPLNGDPSMYMKAGKVSTDGVVGAYVDDNLFAGNENFDKLVDFTSRAFESKPVERDDVEFVGIQIRTEKSADGSRTFYAHQPEYLAKLRTMPKDSTFDLFRSVRAAFSWLSHSRPDICCAVNRAAQVTEEGFGKKAIDELNESISHAKETKDIRLKYPPLNATSLHIRAYADASFATNIDLTSQLGFIIFVCDDANRCHVLHYSSRKSRRVVRSIMAGEVYAFSAAFDVAFVLKHDLERILRRKIPLRMFTDSKQMFDVITRASHTTEKRLMIDVAAAREAYKNFDISNVGLIAGAANPADGLTKPKFCQPLFDILRTGIDATPVDQWIIRKA